MTNSTAGKHRKQGSDAKLLQSVSYSLFLSHASHAAIKCLANNLSNVKLPIEFLSLMQPCLMPHLILFREVKNFKSKIYKFLISYYFLLLPLDDSKFKLAENK